MNSTYIEFSQLLSFCEGTLSPLELARIKQQIEQDLILREIVSNLKLHLTNTPKGDIMKTTEQSLSIFLAGPFAEAFTAVEAIESIQKEDSSGSKSSFSFYVKTYSIQLITLVATVLLAIICYATYLHYSPKVDKAVEERALPSTPTASTPSGDGQLPIASETMQATPLIPMPITSPANREDIPLIAAELPEKASLLSASTSNEKDISTVDFEALEEKSQFSSPTTSTSKDGNSLVITEAEETSLPSATPASSPIAESTSPIGSNLIEEGPLISIPPAFTPNGDGNNDYLVLKINPGVQRILKFEIYDRWGQLNFQATNFRPKSSKGKWDGTFMKKPAPDGVYIVLVVIKTKDKETKTYTEEVSLIR